MSAEFNTKISMKGTEEELLSLLKIVRMYVEDKHKQYRTEHNCAYLADAVICFGNSHKCISDLSNDELLKIAKESDGSIAIRVCF